MSNLFDEFNDHLAKPARAIYQAGMVRDEREVARLLDAHLVEHGEAEQVAYAALHRQDDTDLGHFPFEWGAHR